MILSNAFAQKKKKQQRIKMAGKTVLDDELQEEICNYIKMGLGFKDAAILCGVTERSVMSWKEKGREALEDETIEFGESTERYIRFFVAVEKARRLFKQFCIQSVVKHMPKKPELSLEVLSRRFPQEWGRKDKQISLNNNVNITNKTSVLNANGNLDVDRLRQILADSRADDDRRITRSAEIVVSTTGASAGATGQ